MNVCDAKCVCLRNYVSLFRYLMKKILKTAVDISESFANYACQDKVEIDLFCGSRGAVKLISARRITICCVLY